MQQASQELTNALTQVQSNNNNARVEPPDEITKPKPVPVTMTPTNNNSNPTATKFKPITKFAWDQDGYNGKNVFIYVTLPGVGTLEESNITCDFKENSFDLQVMNLKDINYRLIKHPLNKNIVPEECKFKIKKDRVVITLRKVKGEYGHDHWTDLVEKNLTSAALNKNKDSNKADPSAGLMDMMKQMYDEGDDQMKKTIGEAMLKSRQEKATKF